MRNRLRKLLNNSRLHLQRELLLDTKSNLYELPENNTQSISIFKAKIVFLCNYYKICVWEFPLGLVANNKSCIGPFPIWRRNDWCAIFNINLLLSSVLFTVLLSKRRWCILLLLSFSFPYNISFPYICCVFYVIRFFLIKKVFFYQKFCLFYFIIASGNMEICIQTLHSRK